jgi:hypothetical protein
MEVSNELRELYKETFGKYPSSKMKLETVMEKLTAEGVIKPEEKEPEVKPEPKKEEPKKEASKESLPESQGRGASKLFLVYFRGQARYWTLASINSMKAYADEIKFPEDTSFADAANFNKCKTC